MGALRYKLGKWEKKRKISLGIITFVGLTIVPIALSIQCINEIGLGTRLAVIFDAVILFIGFVLLVLAQVNLRKINRDIIEHGDP